MMRKSFVLLAKRLGVDAKSLPSGVKYNEQMRWLTILFCDETRSIGVIARNTFTKLC
jgi:hypothetical protein